jgi:predicted O-linked N-acetylglucosamine transferase (SPINDLY family)
MRENVPIVVDGSPVSADAAFARGFAQHQDGRLDDATALYRAVLRANPTHADSLHLLGMIARQRGDPGEAVTLIRRAITLRPEAAHYRSNLANALRDLGRSADALNQYREAARLRPDSAEIRCNLGTALLDLGRAEEAIACYRTACALNPDIADFHYNLANALSRSDGFAPDEAETHYRACLRLAPDVAEAHANFGRFLLGRDRLDEAERSFREALRCNPNSAPAWNDLGIVLQRRDRLAEAARCHANAVRLAPGAAAFHYNRGCAALARNDTETAAASYRSTLRLAPDHAAARFALCMANLPLIYEDEAEIARRRTAYTDALRELAADAKRDDGLILASGVGASPPFFLAYQGQDDRALQETHGKLICGLMARAEPAAPMPPSPRRGEKIRVGFVSGFFHDHTVWSLMLRGWLTMLDRDRFSLFGYHTGTRGDARTDMAEQLCARFARGPLSAAAWRQTILADAPHVLIYPEIGMDPAAARLAAQRLAPVQCVSWGHPTTSGFPTMDYFLSADAMEGPEASEHYTERLVRLPGLGIHYAPPAAGAMALSRADLGLRENSVVFWSGQTLSKYLPRHDAIFPRIARAAGDCQFVFIAFARDDAVTAVFRRRLARAFAAEGLNAEAHCVILPAMSQENFIAAIGLCDVVLDTIGWSGGKSTLEALTHDPAIVTLPGPLMRGRHTAAMLRLMDAEATIAGSAEDYIGMAARLARDAGWREAARARVRANKHRLFCDPAPIRALEDFILHSISRD